MRNFLEPTWSTRKGPLGSVGAIINRYLLPGHRKGEGCTLRNCYGATRGATFEQFRAARRALQVPIDQPCGVRDCPFG